MRRAASSPRVATRCRLRQCSDPRGDCARAPLRDGDCDRTVVVLPDPCRGSVGARVSPCHRHLHPAVLRQAKLRGTEVDDRVPRSDGRPGDGARRLADRDLAHRDHLFLLAVVALHPAELGDLEGLSEGGSCGPVRGRVAGSGDLLLDAGLRDIAPVEREPLAIHRHGAVGTAGRRRRREHRGIRRRRPPGGLGHEEVRGRGAGASRHRPHPLHVDPPRGLRRRLHMDAGHHVRLVDDQHLAQLPVHPLCLDVQQPALQGGGSIHGRVSSPTSARTDDCGSIC